MASTGLPPLNWLRAFEAAARHLSFTGAAQELNMTQPAVSQHIKTLEHHLGRALFVRRTRALHLTEAGANYLPIVQEAFATLSAGTRALVGGDRGKMLSVQSNMAFSVFWLAPRLPDLLARYPWLTLNISTVIMDPERTAPENEVEVRFGRDVDAHFAATHLGPNEAYPVTSPALADADWRDTALFDCPGILANWEGWLSAQGESLPAGKMINLCSTYVVSMTSAMHGAGIAMSHDTLAQSPIAEGSLVRWGELSIPLLESYYLLRPAKHAETPANRAFCEWLLEQFGL